MKMCRECPFKRMKFMREFDNELPIKKNSKKVLQFTEIISKEKRDGKKSI